jgi:hypothetical protein
MGHGDHGIPHAHTQFAGEVLIRYQVLGWLVGCIHGGG